MYLSMYVAESYPEQEPAHLLAKWYDALWLLIPIVGVIIFTLKIETRYNNHINGKK